MKSILLALFLALGFGASVPQFSGVALAADCAYLSPVSFSILPDGTSEKTLTLSFTGYTSPEVTVVVRDSRSLVVTSITVSSASPYVLTLPTTPGAYTIQVTGGNCSASSAAVQGPLVVPTTTIARAGLADPGLPTSGSNTRAPIRVAALLVLCGAGFVGVAWRRRRVVRALSAAE